MSGNDDDNYPANGDGRPCLEERQQEEADAAAEREFISNVWIAASERIAGRWDVDRDAIADAVLDDIPELGPAGSTVREHVRRGLRAWLDDYLTPFYATCDVCGRRELGSPGRVSPKGWRSLEDARNVVAAKQDREVGVACSEACALKLEAAGFTR
jgi:hypothetical protein